MEPILSALRNVVLRVWLWDKCNGVVDDNVGRWYCLRHLGLKWDVVKSHLSLLLSSTDRSARWVVLDCFARKRHS